MTPGEVVMTTLVILAIAGNAVILVLLLLHAFGLLA